MHRDSRRSEFPAHDERVAHSPQEILPAGEALAAAIPPDPAPAPCGDPDDIADDILAALQAVVEAREVDDSEGGWRLMGF